MSRGPPTTASSTVPRPVIVMKSRGVGLRFPAQRDGAIAMRVLTGQAGELFVASAARRCPSREVEIHRLRK